MLAFTLSLEDAETFFEICQELKADTEEKRVAILSEMARLGHVSNIVETKKTKEEYLQHLAKNFKVMKIGESKQ